MLPGVPMLVDIASSIEGLRYDDITTTIKFQASILPLLMLKSRCIVSAAGVVSSEVLQVTDSRKLTGAPIVKIDDGSNNGGAWTFVIIQQVKLKKGGNWNAGKRGRRPALSGLTFCSTLLIGAVDIGAVPLCPNRSKTWNYSAQYGVDPGYGLFYTEAGQHEEAPRPVAPLMWHQCEECAKTDKGQGLSINADAKADVNTESQSSQQCCLRAAVSQFPKSHTVQTLHEFNHDRERLETFFGGNIVCNMNNGSKSWKSLCQMLVSDEEVSDEDGASN